MSREFAIGSAHLELVEGDITVQKVGAVVNAANTALAGGGGVDGAIHQAAGRSRLSAACREIGVCPVGSAVITPGFALPAAQIIHAVGPIWQGGDRGESNLLRAAYRASLELAVTHELKSIAFPALSTGAYGYPIEQAAEIALATARDHLRAGSSLELVRFVLFGAEAYHTFERVAERLLDRQAP